MINLDSWVQCTATLIDWHVFMLMILLFMAVDLTLCLPVR